MPRPRPSKVVKHEGRSCRKIKKDLNAFDKSSVTGQRTLEYERRTLMNSRRKRLHAVLETAHRSGLCDASAHDLRCLYSKNVPEEDRPDILGALEPDARTIHERFLQREEAQRAEKLGALAEIVTMDRMMEEADGGYAGATGQERIGDGGKEEETDDDDDMETDREDGGVALATDQ